MTTRSPRIALAAVAGAVVVTLAACGTIPANDPGNQSDGGSPASQAPTTGSTSSPGTSSSPTPTQPPAADPVSFSSNVTDGAKKVKVDTLVSVKAAGGKLKAVSVRFTAPSARGLTTVTGKISGKLAKDGSSWLATERLDPAGSYVMKLSGTNVEGKSQAQTVRFQTQALTRQQQTYPTAYPIAGSTVGVGMPVILRFDAPVKDKANFQRHLRVTTSPKQTGTWRWYSDYEVHYRPKSYWKPGTKVTAYADVNSLPAGNGIYGQRAVSTNFKVGRSVVTRVNLASHVAKVYVNGKLARSIPISGGKPGWQTRSGTKLVMEKLPVVKMTNEMIGAKEDYDLDVKYAVRITSTGEFLHAAPWNGGYLGRANASHGCVGMSTANAAWLFSMVKVGDPVVTTGSSRGLEPGNGYTDWNASWSTYKKGSAL